MATTKERIEPRTKKGRSGFYRMGAFAVRRRRWVILVWLVALVAAFPLLRNLTDNLSQGGFEVPGSQSDQVRIAVEEDFASRFELTDLIVLRSDSMTVDDPAFRAAFEDVAAAVRAAPGVGEVADPYESPERSISEDGRVLTAQVGLLGTQDEALRNNEAVEEAVAEASAGRDVEALLAGAPPFYDAFAETTTHDLERAERVALPISLVILVLAFGSLVAAGMPLAMALFGLALSLGLISALAAVSTVSIFTQNVASMIGIGVGIDYSLFVLSRFRSELAAGHEVPDAVGRSMATSGKAVMVSALTVVIALSGTTLVNIQAFRSMGLGAMIAVAIAGLAALTLLPALLGVVGTRVNKLRLRLRRRRGIESDEATATGRLWHRWAMIVMRRPWIALVGSVALLAILALPVRDLRLGSSGPSILPPDAGPRVAAETVAGAFGEGQVAPVQIVLRHPDGVLDGGFEDVHAVAQSIAADPQVARVDSVATLAPGAPIEQAQAAAASTEAAPFVSSIVSPDGDATLILAVTRDGPQSDAAGDFVKRTRERLPEILPAGLSAAVGGDAGLNVDINREVTDKLIPVVGLVLVLSFLLLMLFFRSLLLPLKAILMNGASVLATYGVLVFIFQQGHFEGLLGFESGGHIEAFLPLFLFTILFGLSMDYEVFLLARIREEYLRTGDNTEAVGWGLEHTAKIITSAAAIMVTVFGGFALASLVPIKEIGRASCRERV